VHGSIEVLNSSSFDVLGGPLASVTLPLEFLQAFGGGRDGEIEVFITLYRNVSHLFLQHLNNG